MRKVMFEMSKTILFMGNSITDCNRDREDIMSLGNGYAAFTAGSLAAKYPGEYSFINRGIAGNRVCDLVSRMNSDIIAHQPDYMSIQTGANDVSQDYMADKLRSERYEKLYSLLVEESLSELPELKIMIFTPFIVPHAQLEKTYEKISCFSVKSLCEAMSEYVEATERVAEKFDLPCVNLQKVFDEELKNAPAEYWSRDGYHPTAMGHGIIAREWQKMFEKVK